MRLNTIGSRIGSGYAILAIGLLITGVFIRVQTGELLEISRRIRDTRAPSTESASLVLSGIADSQSALRTWIDERDSASREQLQSAWTKDIQPALARLKALSANWIRPENFESFADLQSNIIKFRSLQNQLENLPRERREVARQRLNSELVPLSTALRDDVETIISNQHLDMDEDMTHQSRLISQVNRLQLVLLLAGVILCALLTYFVARAVTQPLFRAMRLADDIAAGNYGTGAEIKGSEEINRLGVALEKMRAGLERQSWLNQAQINFYEVIREASGVRDLADAVTSSIANRIQAQVGALYVNEGQKLKMVGGYAYPKSREIGIEFRAGEGLAGQALAERRTLLVSAQEAPGLDLSTSIGSVRPKQVMAAPLLYNEEVVGVLELASLSEIGSREREYLTMVVQSAAIALDAARKAEQVRSLLAETQAQAEELEAQQEELRNANEELQTRQEELEATNEELEEQKSLLEIQKGAIDQRNAELEQTRGTLAQRAEELDRISRYKSEFLANMSHELRTPLNSQLILSKILSENSENNLTEKQKEYAGTIHTSGLNLLQLINDILDLSKVEAGKLSLDLQDVPLQEILTSVERDFRPSAEQKGLKFRVETQGDLPDALRTDSLRLGQILRNFLGNAVKFTEQGEVALKVERISADSIAFHVIDTGIGIPDDKRNAIFQAFEQVDSSTSRKFGGTGLGLAISKGLASLLGGEIRLETKSGAGSTFSLFLPVSLEPKTIEVPVQTEQSAPIQAPTQAFVPNCESSQNTILIIEDDPHFAGVLRDLAMNQGFQCVTASEGAQGIEMAKSHMPFCILLDYRLPGTDGLQVLKELKRDPSTRHIPVHMMSVDDHTREAMELGAVGYLVKPTDPKEISGVLARLEAFGKKKIRRVLVVDDVAVERDQIINLIGNGQVVSTGVGTARDAFDKLKKEGPFDCMVLDLKLPDMSGFDLLKLVRDDRKISAPPVVIYTAKELTRDEEELLRGYSDSIIIKGVRSSERLLDEVSLFLHRVVRDLPPEKQRLLSELHTPEKVFQNKRILLVDDDIRNIFALSSALEQRGLSISVARNGEEALQALKDDPNFHLILMDVMMPVMDGFEAMRRIRTDSTFEKVPIIALTAKAMKGDKEACLKSGASDYVAKPVDLDRLFTLLRVWLSS